jgi:hypothetical protein
MQVNGTRSHTRFERRDMNKLNKAVDRIRELEHENQQLKEQYEHALDSVEDLVRQHCHIGIPPGQYAHDFISANENAFALLEDAGRLTHISHEHYEFNHVCRSETIEMS